MIKKKYIFGMFFIFGILMFTSFASAYMRTVTSGAQYANIAGLSGFGSTNSLKFDKSMCEQGGKDLLVQIVPFGCVPSVVRSDLLEEQNVQVYCQLGATQINPLIDIEAIDYMSFSGEHSKEVSGVGYFPSQSALGIGSGILTSPVLNNLGYVVVTIKQQSNESAMPNYVEGNLTAKIRYDIKNAFGVGDVNFYLPVLNDDEWNERYTQYIFWQGRGYLRALSVDDEGAQIAIYADDSVVTSGAFSREGRTYSKAQYSSFYLNEGEKSEELYLPGFSPCLATLNVRLEDLINPETRVKLKVGSDYVEVAKGEKFLDNKCWVKDINKEGLYQSAKVYCKDDDKPATVTLGISPRVKLKIEGKTEEYGVGDWLFKTANGEKSVYLGYVGSYDNSEKSEDLYIYLVALPEHKEKLSASDLASVNIHANSLKSVKTGASVYDGILSSLKGLAGVTVQAGKWLIKGEDFFFISFKNPNTGVVSKAIEVKGKQVLIDGFGEGEDKGILTLTEDVYKLDPASGGTYTILSDGEKTGLRLDEEKVGETIRLRLEPDNLAGSTNLVSYGKFFSEITCKDYATCPKFSLSTGSEFSPPKNLESFFENLVGAEINPAKNELTVYKAVFDDSSDSEFNKYYENAMKDFQTIDVSFAGEKDSENSEETYGERALYNAISLAYDLNRKKTMLELCDEFKDKYSKSILYADVLDICNNEYKVSSDELSSMEVSINGVIKEISFEGIYEPSFEEYGAELFVQGPTGKATTLNLEKNKIVNLNGLRDVAIDKEEYVKLESLDEDYANIYISVAGESALEKGFSSDTRKLELDNPTKWGEYTFTLKNINLEKSAKVSVKGNFNLQYTEADFGFKIGIEKRSFPLSPETASRKIESLNNSIQDFQKISDTLYKVVKRMKEACAITGGALTVRNMIANLGGKSIARQKIMQGVGGWTEKCTDMVSDKKYVSLDKCFLENSPEIDNEVDEMYGFIQTKNEQMKTLGDAAKNPDTGYIDTNKLAGSLSSETVSDLKNSAIQDTINKDKTKPIDFSNIDAVLSEGSFKEGKYSLEQLKEIALYAEILQSTTTSSDLEKTAKERLYNVLNEVEVNAKTYAQRATLAGSIGVDANKIVYIKTSKNTQKYVYEGLTKRDGGKNLPDMPADTPIAIVQTDLGNYIFVLDNSLGTNIYPIKATEITQKDSETGKETKSIQYQIYSMDGKLVEDKNIIDKLKNSIFEKYDETSYKNKYKNPVLRYHEEESFKRNPAIVPFNTKEGWYAATKPLLSTGGNIQAYDASGRVASFWLCNVGADGLEDFSSSARDDICEMFNFITGQPLNQFSGLSEDKTASLVRDAQIAIEAAQRAYVNGVKKVRIGGEVFNVGSPAVSTPTIQCQDFMSPKDCNLLFNVCDPVVCPSSRCDLGGTFAVKDVIQSGIIGSIALCLPNAKENIVIPVCLSGVQAGMDGWISIQSSYRDCLQQNLDTGETVGICDEVYSIYMCDFFWKQALPLVKLAVPKVLSAILGQNTRGGGEYLGVQDALATAKESIDYFKSYYAANSWKAFKLRSTEEVGSEVCKSFPSIVYPGSGNFLDSLTEPDSPFQFTGNFEETVFTTATNPPISHYKVFYHIYAGKDTGAYYFVSLRQGTGSSYYQDTTLERRVASGYIGIGGYKTDTVDFTAPSGYKQLCINVNGREECGFESVSTSFAVNYMSDLYIKEQTTTQVKTEAECISGTASLYSLLNPNIQSAVEEIIDPAIYENGIIRVCATNNPGLGTNPYTETEDARWVSVGYCGDAKVICWLDRNKVKEIVKSLNIENQILGETSENYLNTLFKQGNYLTTEQFRANISSIGDISTLTKIDLLKNIKLINGLFGKVFFNNQKANLFLIRGEIFSKLAKGAYDEIVAARKVLEAKLEAEAVAGGDCTNGASQACTVGACAGTQICTGGQWSTCIKTDPNCEGRTPTEEELAQAEFNAKYNSPVFRLNDKNLLTTDFCYKYYNGKWQWADCQARNKVWRDTDAFDEYSAGDSILNKPEKVKEVILSLQNYNNDYLGGLTVLIDKTTADKNAELSDESFGITNMDEKGFFKIKFSGADYEAMKVIYFEYRGGEWLWQIDKGFIGRGVWQKTSNIASGFNEEQKTLVNSLNGKTFYEGAAILFDPASLEVRGISESEITPTEEGTECSMPQIECIGVLYFICVNNVWVSQGLVDGKCGYKITPEVCPAPPQVPPEIAVLTDARQRVLKAAEELNGAFALKGSVIKDYDRSISVNCFDSTLHVYNKAGTGLSNCAYSDKLGQQYTSDGKTIKVGVDKKEGAVIYQIATYPEKCTLNSKLSSVSYAQKLDNIKPGDMLSIVYNSESGHSVIFIKWINKGSNLAQVFDWINFDKNYKQVFGYRTIDLSDEEHPVYMYWNPVIS